MKDYENRFSLGYVTFAEFGDQQINLAKIIKINHHFDSFLPTEENLKKLERMFPEEYSLELAELTLTKVELCTFLIFERPNTAQLYIDILRNGRDDPCYFRGDLNCPYRYALFGTGENIIIQVVEHPVIDPAVELDCSTLKVSVELKAFEAIPPIEVFRALPSQMPDIMYEVVSEALQTGPYITHKCSELLKQLEPSEVNHLVPGYLIHRNSIPEGVRNTSLPSIPQILSV